MLCALMPECVSKYYFRLWACHCYYYVIDIVYVIYIVIVYRGHNREHIRLSSFFAGNLYENRQQLVDCYNNKVRGSCFKYYRK